MYIVNTSFSVDPRIHDLWLETLRGGYIPSLRLRGLDGIVFTRVLSDKAEDHFTYSLQVALEDMAAYRIYVEEVFPEYAAMARKAFGDRVLWFNSLLKRVEIQQ